MQTDKTIGYLKLQNLQVILKGGCTCVVGPEFGSISGIPGEKQIEATLDSKYKCDINNIYRHAGGREGINVMHHERG